MEEIWYDVQKGYGYILSSIYYQTLAVSLSNNDLVDMWPNHLCKNSRAIFFLDGNLFLFGISLISPQNACLLCELCGNVTAFFPFATKHTVKKPLWNKQVFWRSPPREPYVPHVNLLHMSKPKTRSLGEPEWWHLGRSLGFICSPMICLDIFRW